MRRLKSWLAFATGFSALGFWLQRAARRREREKAHALQESQQFLSSLVENIPNMIFVKEAASLRFVRFNRAGESLLGAARTDLLGKNDYDLFPKEQADAFTRMDREVLAQKDIIDIPEEPISTPSGLRFLHTKKIPLFDRDGFPQYLVGISEDITEKKEIERQRLILEKAQTAQREAERATSRMAFLAEASAALNASLDLNQTLDAFAAVIANAMADACFVQVMSEDFSYVQFLGAHLRAGESRPVFEDWRTRYRTDRIPGRRTRRVLETGRSVLLTSNLEDRGPDALRDDSEVELDRLLKVRSLIIVPIQSNGQILGTLTMFSNNPTRDYDVLDLSIAEDLGRRAYFSVENARLYERAQEASRAKSAFLTNISHEIRTPLGAILGFADLLAEERGFSEDQRNAVGTILRNGRHLLRIVDEILDLSKIESDHLQVEKIPFSLQQVLEEVGSLMRMRADEKHIRFEISLPSNLPRVVISDPMRLRQILINIIGNAVKFTERGWVKVGLSVRESGSGADHRILDFTVEDSGIGITRDQEKRIFQPFAQADAAMNRRFGGTGLGLFLSRRMARLLGGDLILRESRSAHGSRFELTIDVTVADDRAASAALERSRPDVNAGPRRSGRILVVDDSPDNRALMILFIRALGYSVDGAENGEQAIEKTQGNAYDVIFMDVQMPGVDGFEAVRRLRGRGHRGKVVALTAHAMAGDRERCLAGGFDDYLRKPLSKEDLRLYLERYLRQPDAVVETR